MISMNLTLAKNPKYEPESCREKRSIQVGQVFVPSEFLQEIINDIKQSRFLAKEVGYDEQPDSILIVGESGVGKTELLKRYVSQFPRYVRTNQDGIPCDIVPIVSVSLPDDASGRAAPVEILKALGGEADKPKGTRAELNRRFCNRAKDSKVELIVIDEFHHAFSNITSVQLKNAADWIKNLINKTGIPVVLMGLPICLEILQRHPELRNRFSIVHQIERFSLADIKKWRVFLKKLDQSLGFKYLTGLDEPDLALRLLALSGGLLTVLMKKVIRPAARMAIDNGEEYISIENMLSVSCKRLNMQMRDNPLSKEHFSQEDVLARIYGNEKELKKRWTPTSNKIGDVFN